MARSRCWFVLLIMVGSLLVAVAPAQAATVPTGFTDSLVAAVPNPTAVQGTADGRILVASKQGLLRVIKNGVLLAAPAINLNAKICWNQERGLLGIAVDPNPATKAVYLFYTLKGSASTCPFGTPEPVGAPRNRVSRFILKDDSTIDPASETVLLDGIMSAYGGHNAGDLQVGKDGYLYVSTGDGGCDYLGDSTVPGGSGCGGDNDAARDRNILNGKILRITTSGGIPPDNPFQGSGTVRCSGAGIGPAGSTCQEIFAVGLRNPFRIAFDPNAAATRFFINDVGQNVWEEIDLGAKGADYGWNIREGHCQQTGVESDCGTATPAGFTNPYYDYGHSTGCGSITGGAFVPNGVWPAAYTGAYLYGDYVCGTIYALSASKVRTTLATGLGVGSAVAMAFGADAGTQSLYYVTYNNGGQLHKIRYTGAANRPPSAALTVTPTAGKTPLTVQFNGSASIDPDGNALSYQWAFGDGSPSQTTSVPTISHIYTATGNVTATLTVRDPAGLNNSASVVVHAGNTPPVPIITAPTAGQLFTVGGQYTLTGSATDSEDGALPASALRWTVIKHHATHTHPFLGPVPGNNIPLTGPIPEDLAAAANSFLQIQLSVTDSGGATTTVSRNFNPQKVPVTIATVPAGRTVTVNGGTIVGPTTLTSWRGFGLQVNAQTQTDSAGATYGFDRWSDAGAASHVYTTPATASTLTATLSKRPLPTPPTRIWIGQTGAGQATIAWSPPTDTGGSPITGYRVSRDGTDSGGTGPFSKTVTAVTRFASLTNLRTGGSNYQFSVQAITASGTGPAAAATVAIAPWVANLPTAPVSVSGAADADTATISWQPPADTGGLTVTGYRVSRDGTDTGNTGPFSTVAPATGRSYTMHFLVPGARYNLSVQAITSAGTGPASTAGATTSATAVVSAPSAVSIAQTGVAQVAISWAPPVVLAGKTITGYRVSRDGTDTGNTGPYSTVVSAATRTSSMRFLLVGATYSLSVQALLSDGTVAPIARGSIRIH